MMTEATVLSRWDLEALRHGGTLVLIIDPEMHAWWPAGSIF